MGAIYVIPFYSIIGEQGGALYSYAYNIYSLFLNISIAGLPIAISKIISEYNTLGLYEAKERAYKIGRNIILVLSAICFIVLFVFSKEVAHIIIGDLTDGNSIEDVSFVIKCVSFCLLIVPFLSVSKGYLQGHKFISPTSVSQVIEQVVRIAIILLGSYIAINVFNQSVSVGVGIAVMGAFVGGLVAYIYLNKKIRDNKNLFVVSSKIQKDKVSNKKIVKKIIIYAIPLIIVSVANDIYGITDITLVLRGLSYLGYSGAEAETISSIISTWGLKIGAIITALATGLSISLIPNMASTNAQKDYKEANFKFVQSINVIIVVALPMAIAISMFSGPIYTLFYGYSQYGTIILKYLVFTSFLFSLNLIMNTSLQGLSKYKIIFLNILIGLGVNAILDIPLILLFDKIGIYPYYGAITATIIGHLISSGIILIYLNKDLKFQYKNVWIVLKKTIIPSVCIILPFLIMKIFIPMNLTNRLIQIPILLLYAFVAVPMYLVLMYKSKALEMTFGKQYLDNLIGKLKKVFRVK